MSAVPVRPAGQIFTLTSHNTRLSGLLAVLLLSWVPFAHGADELEDRKMIRAGSSALFMQERFAGLERLAGKQGNSGQAPAFLSLHPVTAERIRRAREAAAH